MCRRIFVGCLVLGALGLAGLGVLYWDVTRPDPAPSGSAGPSAQAPTASEAEPSPHGAPGAGGRRPASPQERRRRAEAIAKRLGDQYERRSRGAGASSRQFEVQLTEQEATEMIRSLPEVRRSLDEAHVDAPGVRFQDDRLIASARVQVYGSIRARVSLTGRVEPRQGRLDYSTESVRIGSIPAPGAVRDALDQQIRAGIRKFNEEFNGRVDQVTSRDGTLTVQGERE